MKTVEQFLDSAFNPRNVSDSRTPMNRSGYRKKLIPSFFSIPHHVRSTTSTNRKNLFPTSSVFRAFSPISPPLPWPAALDLDRSFAYFIYNLASGEVERPFCLPGLSLSHQFLCPGCFIIRLNGAALNGTERWRRDGPFSLPKSYRNDRVTSLPRCVPTLSPRQPR